MKSNLLDYMFYVELNRDNGQRIHYPSGSLMQIIIVPINQDQVYLRELFTK